MARASAGMPVSADSRAPNFSAGTAVRAGRSAASCFGSAAVRSGTCNAFVGVSSHCALDVMSEPRASVPGPRGKSRTSFVRASAGTFANAASRTCRLPVGTLDRADKSACNC